MAEQLTRPESDELNKALEDLGNKAVEAGMGQPVRAHEGGNWRTVGHIVGLPHTDANVPFRALAWLLGGDQTILVLGTSKNGVTAQSFDSEVYLTTDVRDNTPESVLVRYLGERYKLTTTLDTAGARDLAPHIGQLLREAQTHIDDLLAEKHAAEAALKEAQNATLQNALAALAVDSATRSSSEA